MSGGGYGEVYGEVQVVSGVCCAAVCFVFLAWKAGVGVGKGLGLRVDV